MIEASSKNYKFGYNFNSVYAHQAFAKSFLLFLEIKIANWGKCERI